MAVFGSYPIMAFVATKKPDRARDFYVRTLGLRLVSEDSFALVFDAGGTMLRVAIVSEVHPTGYTVLGWIVPDVSRAILNLSHRGVAFERYDGLLQDDKGVWTAPSGAKIVWFKDPDGNTLSLTEFAHPDKEPRPKRRDRRKSGFNGKRKVARTKRRL